MLLFLGTALHWRLRGGLWIGGIGIYLLSGCRFNAVSFREFFFPFFPSLGLVSCGGWDEARVNELKLRVRESERDGNWRFSGWYRELKHLIGKEGKGLNAEEMEMSRDRHADRHVWRTPDGGCWLRSRAGGNLRSMVLRRLWPEISIRRSKGSEAGNPDDASSGQYGV